MILYEFHCPAHGRFEAFGELKATAARCPECGGHSGRRFSAPVTDNRTIGKDMAAARTRPTERKPGNEIQEELIHGYQRRDGTHRQWGAGKTTGS